MIHFCLLKKGKTMKFANGVKILLLCFYGIIQGYLCFAKFTRYIREQKLDNRIKDGIKMVNKNNMGECVQSCEKTRECNSFIFNTKNDFCVILSDSFISFNNTENEDGWIFFRKRCDDEWEFFKGHCFQRFSTFMSWNELKEFCNQEGGWLAEINDDETVDFLRTIEGSYNWLGGTDFDEDGNWHWDHSNTLISYDGWRRSEPGIGNGENCMVFINYQWSDYRCVKNFPMLCEKLVE